MITTIVASSLAAFAGSYVLTGVARRYALRRRILDVPDHRSSHTVPTPRGGGIAIVAVVLTAALAFGMTEMLPWGHVAALTGGGAMVALIGFVDDHGHVPAAWRLVGHFAAAAWVVAWAGGIPPLPVPGGALDLGLAGSALAVLALVWLVNLTNFMDGTDGIAGVEALTVCAGGVAVQALAGSDPALILVPAVLAAAASGFLLWNWAPARIFMGDGGSGFLGLVLGAFALEAGRPTPDLLWCWVILLGVFVVDATTTLFRRLLRGEAVYQAHRSHAYQHAARRWSSHRRVAVATGVINLVWLFPLAAMVALDRLPPIPATVLAYVPLLALVLHFDAGARARQPRVPDTEGPG